MSQNNNIPKHRQLKKLGEVCTYSKGKKPSVLKDTKTKDCTVPYINIKAFEKGIFDEYTNGEKCNLCNDDDLLMVWDGARCGLIGKAKKGAVGSTLMKILPKENIHKEYLYHFISSKFWTLNTRPKGVGIPHIEPTLLWNFELVVSPLPEQQAIVSKIEALLSELENGKQQLLTAQQQLKVYRQSLLKWAFEGKLGRLNHDLLDSLDDPDLKMINSVNQGNQENHKNQGLDKGELPKGWKWVKLNEICKIIGGVTKGKDYKGKQTISLPYLRVANVQDGYLDLRIIKTIEVLPTDLEKYRLVYGDILYTEGGDKDKLGRGTIWKNELENCIHQNHIFRARPLSKSINSKYIAYFSQTQSAKNYFYKHGKQTTNLASINLTILSGLSLPLCSLEEQQLIVSELESKLTVCDKLEETISQSLQQAETLRQSILKKAFEGKLVNFEMIK
jgi:type I restriction enzyme, S subunit